MNTIITSDNLLISNVIIVFLPLFKFHAKQTIRVP